jgi:hypothetical protein
MNMSLYTVKIIHPIFLDPHDTKCNSISSVISIIFCENNINQKKSVIYTNFLVTSIHPALNRLFKYSLIHSGFKTTLYSLYYFNNTDQLKCSSLLGLLTKKLLMLLYVLEL